MFLLCSYCALLLLCSLTAFSRDQCVLILLCSYCVHCALLLLSCLTTVPSYHCVPIVFLLCSLTTVLFHYCIPFVFPLFFLTTVLSHYCVLLLLCSLTTVFSHYTGGIRAHDREPKAVRQHGRGHRPRTLSGVPNVFFYYCALSLLCSYCVNIGGGIDLQHFQVFLMCC